MAPRSWSYGYGKDMAANRWSRAGYHGGHRNRGPYSVCEGCGNYAYYYNIKESVCKKCQHVWPDSVLNAAGVSHNPSAPGTSGTSGLIEYARKLKEAGKPIDAELLALLPPDALTVTPPSQRQLFNKQQEEYLRVHTKWKKACDACFKAQEHKDRLLQQLAAQTEKVSKLNEEMSVAGVALSQAEADLHANRGNDMVDADTPSYAHIAKNGGGGLRCKPTASQEEKDAHDPVRTAIEELVQKAQEKAARDDGEGNSDAMVIPLEALQTLLLPAINNLAQAAKIAQRSSPYGGSSSAPSSQATGGGSGGGPNATGLPIPQSQLVQERKEAAELAARVAQNLPTHS